ncbi:hypothetical protein CHUAL_006095 [Chamberlinius hualienensis]
MNADRITIRRLVAGTILFICGSVQVAAGITFLILLNTIFRIASNIFTGIANVALGIVLVSSFNKRGHITTACIGATILNSINLFILEILEWKDSQDGLEKYLLSNSNIILLVTTVPSLVVVFLAFFACQDLCWNSIMRKRYSQTADKRMSLGVETTDYNWVFRESESWITNSSNCNEQSIELESSPTSSINNNTIIEISKKKTNLNLQTFSLKHQRSGISNSTASIHSESQVNIHYNPLPTALDRVYKSQSEDEEDILPIILNRRSLINTDHKLSSKAAHLKRSKSDVKSNKSAANIQSVSNKRNISSRLTTSPPRPFDNDSLVHLKQLELLARQWRFHAQHKMLKQMFLDAKTTISVIKTTVLGAKTTVLGAKTTVLGAKTTVLGAKTTVLGAKTTVLGAKTTVLGAKTTVLGAKTTVLGAKTTVLGAKTTILGAKTTILGAKTTILGVKTTVLM